MSEKILILQTAFLGDLILSTSFFHAVRIAYPEAEIHVVCNAGTENVLTSNQDINLVIPFDKKKIKRNLFSFFEFALQLRKNNYDVIFSPHFSHRSSLLSWFTTAPIRVGYVESGFSFLHTKKVPRPITGPHEVDKLFSLLFDDPSDYPSGRERRPYLYSNPTDDQRILNLLSSIKISEREYIILAPSSLWETKRLPEEKFVSVISQILRKRQESIILIGSKSDLEIEARIFQLLKIEPLKEKERTRLHSFIGKTSLGELSSLISKSKAIISNDSSPIHYASAFNIPTVMIYGATIPAFGYSALSTKNRIIEVPNLSCRPCGIHGGRFCPEKHFKCMLEQDPLKIFNALEAVLEK